MSRTERQPRQPDDAMAPMYYAELPPRAELAHWHFRVDPDAGAIEHWIPLTGGMMVAVPRGAEPITVVASAVGLSPRQLRRRFRAATGMTPKELARIRRLRTAAVDAVDDSGEPWVGLAARHGYSDQAHLVREFRELMGLTPGAFEDHVRRIRHGRVFR